jgi:hypothetical protein
MMMIAEADMVKRFMHDISKQVSSSGHTTKLVQKDIA